MAKWRKSPPELIDRFHAAIPPDDRIEIRKMFGYPAAFLNGNMFAGLHQENFILRLSSDDLTTAKEDLGATPFEPMKGRQMREYIALPDQLLADETQLADWIARSAAFVGSLPKKEKKRG